MSPRVGLRLWLVLSVLGALGVCAGMVQARVLLSPNPPTGMPGTITRVEGGAGGGGGGGGGTSLVLDIGNDAVNESTTLEIIATTGDAHSIFTESSVNKLLIDLTKDWPKADLADALTANGANCLAGFLPRGVDTAGAAEDCIALSPVTAITTTYQVLASDFEAYKTLAVNDGAFTITLTAVASQPPAGTFITVVNYGGGPITIAPNGQTINGESEVLVLPGSIPQAPSSARIVSTGTAYVASLAGQDLPLSKLPIIESQTVLGRTTAGTGATEVLTTSQVKTMLGIDQVDNTSDATKLSAVGVLSNKLVLDRVSPVTGPTITPDLDLGDVFTMDTISTNLTINAPIGTGGKPFNEEWIVFRFKSSTPRTLAWNSIFTNEHGIPLPTATTGDGTTVDRIKFVYNSTTTKWGLVASTIAPIRDVTTLASSTTYTCNADLASACEMSMIETGGTLTVVAPTGTPRNGQQLMLRMRCQNAQTVTMATGAGAFVASPNVSLLTTCQANMTQWTAVGVIYSSVLNRWQVYATN